METSNRQMYFLNDDVEGVGGDSMFHNTYHVGGNLQQASHHIPVLDYQWLTSYNSLQNSLVLEREKNFERIHKWLSYQHEYSGHPPPDDEQWSSLRSSSAVDACSPVEEFTDHFPRYRSEEHIQTTQELDNQDNILKFTGLKRYYSPINHRRRYSPRSDPTLNKTVVNSTNSFAQMIDYQPELNRTDFPQPLNYYFYQSGKGNTFPRRSRVSISSSGSNKNAMNGATRVVRRKIHPPNQLNHHVKRYRPLSYDERVMPEPYAPDDSSAENYKVKHKQQRPTSMVEGRSFVLNGISTTSKPDSSQVLEKNSSMLGNMSLDTQRLLTCNLPDVALTAAKAIHKRELSDSMPKFHLPKETTHVRVSSAPEPIENHYRCETEEKVKMRSNDSKRVPLTIRKVKASSWPKRAVIPPHADTSLWEQEISNVRSNQKTESGYVTEKSDDKNTRSAETKNETEINTRLETGLEHVEEASVSCHEIEANEDLPPARPPPPAHHPDKKTNRPSSHCTISSSIKHEELTSPLHQEQRSNLCKRQLYQSEQCFNDLSRERYLSSYSACSCTSPNDLSKTVSMSLKDLIRIHEQEIARVSAGASSSLKGIDNIREKSRNSSLSDTRQNSSWKRHTTIGLLTNYSLDHYKESDDTSAKYTSSNASPTKDDMFLFHEDHEHHRSFSDTIDTKPLAVSLSSDQFPTSPKSQPEIRSTPEVKPKHDSPATLPKPKKRSLGTVIVEPSYINVNSAREQFANLTSPGMLLEKPETLEQSSPKQDVMIQTDDRLKRSDSFKKSEQLVVSLTKELEKVKLEHDHEREDLLKKLEEQKKVANAYQKLENRYRKKVCSLQKAMRNCVCSENVIKGYGNEVDRMTARQSLSPSVLLESHDDISIQKVDSVLHQLEAWLNHQTGGVPTDTSEISSIVDSTTDEMYSRYKYTSDYFSSPPLEIIDKIDATSV